MRRIFVSLVALLPACGGGSPWQAHDLPDDGSPFPVTLSTVWSFAPSDVWAGGSTILHFDGARWSERGTSPPRGVEDLWGFAPDDLWGASGDVVLHWDGASWSEIGLDPVNPSGSLVAIWGVSGEDLWVGTDVNGEAIHWDGSTWTLYITQTIQVSDLWGSGPDDVWAVGFGGYSHWNGTTWTQVEEPEGAVSPEGLWGFAANDVWAADSFGSVAHFDGTSWTGIETDEDQVAIWGAAPGDLWAVGDLGVVSHFDGSDWSTERLGSVEFFTAVHGSSASDVWIVGNDLRAGRGVAYRHE